MGWTKLWTMRLSGFAALALVAATGCGDDNGKSGGDSDGDDNGDEAPADGDTDIGGEQPPPELDASRPRMDASDTPPANDGGVLPDASEPAPDGARPGNPPLDVSLNPLPTGGDKLSICYQAGDCTGDDLVCYTGTTLTPGFCTDDCAQDSDCPEIEGLKATCSTLFTAPTITAGQCEISCAGDANDGTGECPKDMVCRDLGRGGLLDPRLWRCTYPVGGGSRESGAYGKCDTSHLSGDCKGLNICHQPSLDLSSALAEHGYCAPLCEQDADCNGEGSTARGLCVLGRCELECSAAGATCPAGMNCKDIDSAYAFETNRCVFVD